MLKLFYASFFRAAVLWIWCSSSETYSMFTLRVPRTVNMILKGNFATIWVRDIQVHSCIKVTIVFSLLFCLNYAHFATQGILFCANYAHFCKSGHNYAHYHIYSLIEIASCLTLHSLTFRATMFSYDLSQYKDFRLINYNVFKPISPISSE